jgi:hypothetical protein
MVVESPTRLTSPSHKKQKDFHLTLATLTEPYDTLLLPRVLYGAAGNVIETHDHEADFKVR